MFTVGPRQEIPRHFSMGLLAGPFLFGSASSFAEVVCNLPTLPDLTQPPL